MIRKDFAYAIEQDSGLAWITGRPVPHCLLHYVLSTHPLRSLHQGVNECTLNSGEHSQADFAPPTRATLPNQVSHIYLHKAATLLRVRAGWLRQKRQAVRR